MSERYDSLASRHKRCEDESNEHCLKVLRMGSSLGSYVKCADDFMKKCEKMIQKMARKVDQK